MLMTDLKHDVVKSHIARLDRLPREDLQELADDLAERGRSILVEENVPRERMRVAVEAELRYLRQYHEVSLPLFPLDDLEQRFHEEHSRLYGYHLKEEGTPLELINLRARAVGLTDKPKTRDEKLADPDPGHAAKSERDVWIPERSAFSVITIFDGHLLQCGNRIVGPGVVEQRNTTLFISAAFDMVVDQMGSFIVYDRNKQDALPATLRGDAP
jgi:N-methylhydantoinase A